MKYITLISMIWLTASCGDKGEIENKKSELKRLNAQAKELEEKITELQNEIIHSDSTLSSNINLVRIMRIKPIEFSHYLRVEGVIKTKEDVNVTPEFQGSVKELFVHEGERVTKGQLLAKLNTSVLEEQLGELTTRYELANTVFKKQLNLWNQKIGSEMQFLQAKSNKEALEKSIARLNKQLDLASVTAPIDGYVETIYIKKGALASPMQPLARIVNTDDLYAEADIAEYYQSRIRTGDTVEIETAHLIQKGVISLIGKVINPQNRSFKIQVKIKNMDSDLKINALAEIKIRDIYVDSAMVIPSACVLKDMKGQYVYVAEKQTNALYVARKKYILPGSSNEQNQTLIKKGLSFKDLIIIDGYNRIANGVQVMINKKEETGNARG